MTSEFPLSTIGDISLRITKGTTPTTASGGFSSSGIAFVKVESITSDGRLDRGKFARISEHANQMLARSVLQEGDVLFTIAGSIGRVAHVPGSVLPANTNQAVAIIRPNRELVDPLYLYYALRDPRIAVHAQTRIVQSVQANFSLAELAAVEVPLPDLWEQRQIAKILGDLDEKIDTNCGLQALGEQWIRCEVHQFLDRASDDGAETVSLGHYCSLVRDNAKVGEFGFEDLYVGLEHMPRGSIVLDSWGDASRLGSNKSRFQKGDILFGKLRPYFKKVGVAPASGVCSTDILVVRPRVERDQALIAIICSSDALIDSLSAAATGTKMPRASWQDLASWQMPCLGDVMLEELSSQVTPVLGYLTHSVRENQELERLRDTLLPELLSGCVRTPKARQPAGGIV